MEAKDQATRQQILGRSHHFHDQIYITYCTLTDLATDNVQLYYSVIHDELLLFKFGITIQDFIGPYMCCVMVYHIEDGKLEIKEILISSQRFSDRSRALDDVLNQSGRLIATPAFMNKLRIKQLADVN